MTKKKINEGTQKRCLEKFQESNNGIRVRCYEAEQVEIKFYWRA